MTQSPIITIPLPNGGRIETYGIKHIAGAAIHIFDGTGEMQLRVRAKEMEEDPAKHIQAIMKTLGTGCVNTADVEFCDFSYELTDGLRLSSNGEDLCLSNSEEIIYYNMDEIRENAEETLGALLMAWKRELENTENSEA